jgi:osomolarity two-component system response regulator SKN7
MNQEKVLNLPSVLIVDDNVKNLQTLGGFLQNEGLMVEFALDGMSALSWLEKEKFDMILLDVIMPGMDGSIISYDLHCKKLVYSGTYNSIYLIRDNEIIEFKGDKMPLSHLIGVN